MPVENSPAPEEVVLAPTLEFRGGRTCFGEVKVEYINELKRGGLSIQAISNLTGYDRKTIRKYLLTPAARPEYASRQPAVSKLEPFKSTWRNA
jgi:hypothetical protein